MLTNNFKEWTIGALHTASDSSSRFYKIIDINGNPTTSNHGAEGNNKLDYDFGAYTLEKLETLYKGASLFVGTGQKEESPEDIALESIVPDSDLTIISANKTFSNSENAFYFTKTLTYIGANDITINEVAFYKQLPDRYSTTKFYVCCLARQKIEPLTVSNGDTFTVTMVIG